MFKRNLRAGFSLVEMLLVATIFSIISVGIAMSFFSGVRVWERAKATGSVTVPTLLAFERMIQELCQSVDLPSIGFEGSGEEVSFPSLRGSSILKVTYRFDPQAGQVTRKEVGLEQVLEGQQEQSGGDVPLFSADEFALSYWDFDPEGEQFLWRDSWEKEKGPLSGVRWRVKVQGEEFEKTLFLPQSS